MMCGVKPTVGSNPTATAHVMSQDIPDTRTHGTWARVSVISGLRARWAAQGETPKCTTWEARSRLPSASDSVSRNSYVPRSGASRVMVLPFT